MPDRHGADVATLERSYAGLGLMEISAAETVLKEAKQIIHNMGVVFFLRQGTCLGAIRDQSFIPWDDDLDLGSIIGLNGLTGDRLTKWLLRSEPKGFFASVERNDYSISVSMIKSPIIMDWTSCWIINDEIIHFPGNRLPTRLFTQLKEIDFIGEKYLVPSPPEDYLRLKYGAEWMVPKLAGYEKDIVDMIPETLFTPGRGSKTEAVSQQTYTDVALKQAKNT